MDAQVVSLILATLGSLVLGFIVFLYEPKNRTNRLFLVLTLSLSGWAVLTYISTQFPEDPDLSLLLIRFTMFVTVAQAVSFFFFIHTFPNKKIHLKKIFSVGLLTAAAVVMALTLSPLVFSHVEISGKTIMPVPGPGIALFALVAVGSILGGLFILIRRYIKARNKEKLRLRYILIGLLMMFALMITFNFLFVVLFSNTTFVVFGALYMLPFLILTTYAIVRHNLLNIRVIATELFVGLMSFVLLWQALIYEGLALFIFRIIVFGVFVFFGTQLLRSVYKEIRLRKKVAQLAKELRTANNRLVALDQAKTEFLSIASHQLRSPMASIKGYMSMLTDGDYGDLSGDQKQIISKVSASTDSLVQLVNLFLDVTRIEEGRFELDGQKTNLKKLCQTVVEQFQPQARAKNISLEFVSASKKLPLATVDPEKIKNVIINLTDNAIKYSSSGSVKISLSLRNKPLTAPKGYNASINKGLIKGDRLAICVEDSGVGLTRKNIGSLFRKFFRVNRATQAFVEGTGLGLYVVNKITDLHGGELGVWSRGQDKGTTFCFTVGLQPPSGTSRRAQKFAKTDEDARTK